MHPQISLKYRVVGGVVQRFVAVWTIGAVAEITEVAGPMLQEEANAVMVAVTGVVSSMISSSSCASYPQVSWLRTVICWFWGRHDGD